MKRHVCRLIPLCLSLSLAIACLIGARGVQAGLVFQYQFPDSWDGTGTTINDLSGAGHHGTTTGTPTLSSNVPPGAPAGSQSIHTNGGGFRTNDPSLLTNPLIAAAGGFRFDATFFWDGSNNGFTVQKIIDYAGTEFLQLQAVNTVAGTATLRFGFNDSSVVGTQLNTTISANQWYNVSGIFNTLGNAIAPDGSLSGQATLIVNGNVFTDPVTKSNFGDSLNRRIGVGNFSNSAGALLQFQGEINSASVQLVPEPATAMLIGLGVTSAFIVFPRRFS